MSPHSLFIKRLALPALVVLLCAVALDGFGLSRAAARATDATPALTRQNGKIVFADGFLYTINPDGSDRVYLAGAPTSMRSPAWSPDASKLVFSRTYLPWQDSNLHIVGAAGRGTEDRMLTHEELIPGVATSTDARWSPDGTRLAYVSTRSGNPDIWVINSDGSNPTNLTADNPLPDYDPTWSPDGMHIAFSSQRDFPNLTNDASAGLEIYVMTFGGLNVTRLTDNQVLDAQPAWSPVNDKLAFTRGVANGQTGEQTKDIFTMNADGTGQTNITNHPSLDLDPSWAPDGTRIAFTSFRDAVQNNNNSEIYVMDADGGSPTRVTDTPGRREHEPDWGALAAAPTPTPATPYRIAGRVTDSAGNGVPGVHVMLITGQDGSRSTLTKADGSYQHFYFADTRITLSPAKNGYSFNPSNVSFVSSGSITGDRPDVNFTAIPFALGSTTFNFSAPTFTINEGSSTASFAVTRSGDPAGILTGGALVSYRTVDDPAAVRCDAAGSTAYARCDYATGVDTLYFAAGETQKSFTISLFTDTHVENTESFALELFDPVGATLGAQSRATVNIIDNDAPGQANPIDDSLVFVRQQYLDFLSREPDSAGFEAWFNVLDRCSNVNDNPLCDRLTVSSGFSLSAEFRLKGYFVYRFYTLSYGRMPRYAEIIPDMASVSGARAAEVVAKRAAFADAWVARREFRNLYDAKTNADFVNTLMERHGLTQITTPDPSNPDGAGRVTFTRDGLVNRLDNQHLTRAQVVRAIVESNEVSAAQFNPAFVAMQYFGYLRRDPDPDYNKWLTYLNEHPDDFRTMVSGFMNSVEYRLRFGRP